MKLSRSRIIVLVLLAAAAAALAVDRLVLAPSASGPKQAVASPAAASASPSVKQPVADGLVEASIGAAGSRLADRLQTASEQFELDPAGMRDGFRPVDAWLADLAPPAPPAEDAQPALPAGPSPADLFASRHTLTSVMLSRRGGSAVVDGKVVRLNQALDGFTLVRLTRDAAVFEADDERVELRLHQQAAVATDR